MRKIIFYRDRNGKEPVYEFIKNLASKNGKEYRIQLNKIQDYIEILNQYGLSAGEPYLKHLDSNIWELRPARNRILFAAIVDDTFVLLHPFVKKTKKTPKREIERAKREFKDYLERRDLNE